MLNNTCDWRSQAPAFGFVIPEVRRKLFPNLVLSLRRKLLS